MLEVTASALNNVKDYMSQQNINSPIRVTMVSGGCSGPSLALAIDDLKEGDRSFDHDGISFVVNETLLASCGAIKVDFIEQKTSGCGCGGGGGFSITSEKPLSGGSCSCSSGSCGC
jgi:iron-sulfur cluster assembly protein